MSAYVSPITGEEPYSGPYQNVLDVLRVMNIGEGRMAQIDEPTIHRFQLLVDSDIDSLLSSSYQVPIRSYNQTKIVDTGISPISVEATAGVQNINAGDSIVTVSGQAWGFLPTSVIGVVSKPSGDFNIYVTVREDTITTDGFVADLSAVAGVGYSLSYIVSAPGSTGTTVRVFPGDVRRAALYWTAGQILISEFQQLEANLTEQATQMVADARMQVYAMVRTNHRIPGQRRISWSKTMPPNLQPNAFPERPS